MTGAQPSSGGPVIEWAVRGRPYPGERESGDCHVAAEFPNGVLVGVIDGLGHGSEAAVAARRAAEVLTSRAGEPVLKLIRECHEALRSTRGAVLSLASIDAARGSLCWAGVGNVEAVLNRANGAAERKRERILLRSGVVGYQLPPLRATDVPIFPGDTLVLATDGLRSGFGDDPPIPGTPAEQADHLLRTYEKSSDDALVLVAHYRGQGR